MLNLAGINEKTIRETKKKLSKSIASESNTKLKESDMFYTKIYKPEPSKNKNLQIYMFPLYFHRTSKTPCKMMIHHQLFTVLAIIPVINCKIVKMSLIT